MNLKERNFQKATKMWQILKMAVRDLILAEKDGCQINMTNWYKRDSDNTCYVCLAGAVMRRRLSTRDACMVPGDYPSDIRDKLEALNALRTGHISSAFAYMGKFIDVPDMKVTSYHENRDRFLNDIRNVINFLEQNDL